MRSRLPAPLFYPRECYINAATRGERPGLYFFSLFDPYRLRITYPCSPISPDMEVGIGITHMKRDFCLENTV